MAGFSLAQLSEEWFIIHAVSNSAAEERGFGYLYFTLCGRVLAPWSSSANSLLAAATAGAIMAGLLGPHPDLAASFQQCRNDDRMVGHTHTAASPP